MNKIKIIRNQKVIEIYVEEMRKNDVFAIYDGIYRVCTREPVFDNVSGYYFIQSGFEEFCEINLIDV